MSFSNVAPPPYHPDDVDDDEEEEEDIFHFNMGETSTWRDPPGPLFPSEPQAPDRGLAPCEYFDVAFPIGRDDANTLLPNHLDVPVVPRTDPVPQAMTRPVADSYMGRSSPFSLDSVPDEMSFMGEYPPGAGTLTYTNDQDSVDTVGNLNLWIIEERCPLLAHAFEDGRTGPQLYLEALTSGTVAPFLRFLYTGTYVLNGSSGGCDADVPTSVLLHCQLYRLGDLYDLPDLKTQAYVNVLRQCEFGCSSPDKPIDLCPAISFVYQHLHDHPSLIDSIVGYCTSCFTSHRLGEDVEFRELAYSLRPFHQALCKQSIDRWFENETAAAIIQLPFKPYAPETYASREDVDADRIADVVHHFHSTDEYDSPLKKRRKLAIKEEPGCKLDALPAELAAIHSDSTVVPTDGDDQDAEQQAMWPLKEDDPIDGLETESDSGYEVVPMPPAAEDSGAESDSDASSAVIVARPTPELQPRRETLPIRERGAADPSGQLVGANATDDSDWEWTEL